MNAAPVRWLARRWLRLNSNTRTFLGTAASVTWGFALALAGALLGELDWSNNLKDALLTAVIWLVGLLVAAMIGRAFGNLVMGEVARREKVISDVYDSLDRWIARDTADLVRHTRDPNSATSMLEHHTDSLTGLVEGLFHVLNGNYGKTGLLGSRMSMEVTYMTKSLKDREITIAAYANTDGRAPVSLRDRAQNPTIYDKTVAAKYLKGSEPSVQATIIADTSKPSARYSELYDGQKSRIRSTIVFPVFAPDNHVSGVLVTHCDEVGFFEEHDRGYWETILTAFGSRMGLVHTRLNAVAEKIGARESLPY